MRQVKFGATDKHVLRGQAIKGIVFNAFIVHGTINTAFVLSTNVVDFAQVIVSCELKRGGRFITIFNDVLFPLAMESNFKNGSYDEFKENDPTPQVLVVQTAALYHTLLQTCEINLHDVLVLSGDDELVFEIAPNANAPIATVSNANSWMEWDVKEGIGNGLSVPVIRCESIQAAQSATNVPLGDNVVSAYFVNKDKEGVVTASQVLQTFAFNSDKYSLSDSYNEMLGKRNRQFPSTALAQARHQSFRLVDTRDADFVRTPYDIRLHKANLRMTFTAANVTAAKNWVVSRAYVNDQDTLAEAKVRDAKHERQNAVQYSA